MKRLLLGLIQGYGLLLRPLMRVWGSCRFVPSCSEYAQIAIERHGVVRGSGKAVWRIARCNPLSKGGEDWP